MLITLIVPFYNEEEHLTRSIRSIQQQTFADYEVLLIDDLSTDGSYALAKRLTQGDSHFRLLRNEQKGLYYARNKALAAALGEYICFLDADDELLPEYLSDLYEDSRTTEADIVIHGFYRIQRDQQQTLSVSTPGVYDLEQDPQSFFASYDVSYMGNVFGKLYRRRLIQQHQLSFSSQVLMCEDMYFVLSYLAVCRHVILSQKANYHYIQHSRSMSTCYWSFETEQQGYLALGQAWYRLLDRYECPALLSSFGSFTGSYVHRLIFSALTHPSSKRMFRTNLNIIHTDYLPDYRQYYSPSTFFTKSLKGVALAGKYGLFRILMRLAILRYHIDIHYC